jgi:hypothetical protein
MSDRTPYTVRPLQNEYIIVGKIVANNDYLKWSRWEFISAVMKEARGFYDPDRASQLYTRFMLDAGLRPIDIKSGEYDEQDRS